MADRNDQPGLDFDGLSKQMSASRFFLPSLVVAVAGVASAFGLQFQRASAEVVGAKVPPPLAAAIRADVEARGYTYGGDCKFDSMYLAPGMWCSFVQSISLDGADVTYGRFASDEIVTAEFTRQGEYGWVNPATGVATPASVPLLSAQQSAKPDSWLIGGMNFPASTVITFFDGSGCGGEQRCPTDHSLGQVKTAPDGSLKIVLQLEPNAQPVPGQVNRLIQATGGAFIQVAFHHSGTGAAPTPADPSPTPPAPTQPAGPTPARPAEPTPAKPSPADPTPSVPDSGDDEKSDDDTNAVLFGVVGVLGLATLGALGVMTVKRRQ
jgi:tRNA(adenine34) deaminase